MQSEARAKCPTKPAPERVASIMNALDIVRQPCSLSAMSELIESWLLSADLRRTATAALATSVLITLSGWLAAVATKPAAKLLRRLGVAPPEFLEPPIRDLLQTMLIAGALLHFLRVLDAPDPAGWALESLLASAVLLHIFGGAYHIVSPMISFIFPGTSTDSLQWLSRVVKVVVIILAWASLLELWGVKVSSALAGVGVLGAGIAIALQDFLRNLVAGVNNVGERRFRRGDWIEVRDVEGTIQHTGVRSTTIMGFDRVPRHVPNSFLSENVLKNKSRIDHRRIQWTIPIVRDATDEQIDDICSRLRSYMEQSGEFLTDGSRPCVVLPIGLSESSIDVMIYVYVETADWEEALATGGRLLLAVRRCVSSAGTALAYPTRTVQFSDLQRDTSSYVGQQDR